jgi:hypothetical protein
MVDDARHISAEYLANMCDELAKMAKQNQFTLGATLLKMASIEFLEQQDKLRCMPSDRES